MNQVMKMIRTMSKNLMLVQMKRIKIYKVKIKIIKIKVKRIKIN